MVQIGLQSGPPGRFVWLWTLLGVAAGLFVFIVVFVIIAQEKRRQREKKKKKKKEQQNERTKLLADNNSKSSIIAYKAAGDQFQRRISVMAVTPKSNNSALSEQLLIEEGLGKKYPGAIGRSVSTKSATPAADKAAGKMCWDAETATWGAMCKRKSKNKVGREKNDITAEFRRVSVNVAAVAAFGGMGDRAAQSQEEPPKRSRSLDKSPRLAPETAANLAGFSSGGGTSSPRPRRKSMIAPRARTQSPAPSSAAVIAPDIPANLAGRRASSSPSARKILENRRPSAEAANASRKNGSNSGSEGEGKQHRFP